MDPKNIFLFFLLLIAILIPPQTNMGAKGFMKNWDRYIEKPSKRVIPPRFIRIRYGVRKSPINIITCLSFLVDFADWILCIVMLPCLLILKDESLNIAFLVYVIIFMVINLPMGIIKIVCTLKIAKNQKRKVNSENSVAAFSLLESLAQTRKTSSEHRKAMRRQAAFQVLEENGVYRHKKKYCINKTELTHLEGILAARSADLYYEYQKNGNTLFLIVYDKKSQISFFRIVVKDRLT